MCSVDGCANKVNTGGLCDTHRRDPCSMHQCKEQRRHGGKDATPWARPRVSQGHCRKHSAHGCTTNAYQGKGVCTKHSTDKVACSAEGCSSYAKLRGFCVSKMRRKIPSLLQTVVQLLSLEGSARNTAPLGSALSAIAPLPLDRQRKERAASMAVAAIQCARRNGRLHHVCASTRRLFEAWCFRNVPGGWLHHCRRIGSERNVLEAWRWQEEGVQNGWPRRLHQAWCPHERASLMAAPPANAQSVATGSILHEAWRRKAIDTSALSTQHEHRCYMPGTSSECRAP